MLDQQQLKEWCRKLSFTTQTESLIQQIRSSAPARPVRSRRGNVSGRYPSRKMGVTIQFESHRNELAAIYELEHDPTVIELYDQPPAIKLNWKTTAGKQIGIWHTPDFFVIRTDSAGYEECKEEKELLQLAEKSPQRYGRDEWGHWRCPPGEDYAGRLGLYYRLRSSEGIDWVWQRNIQFLEDYLRYERPLASSVAHEAVCSLVKEEWGISLGGLMSRLEKVIDHDELYSLIATGEVYVDLAAASLINPEEVRVYATREAALANAHLMAAMSRVKDSPISPVTVAGGEAIIWDGTPWRILNIGNTLVALGGDGGSLSEVPRLHFENLVKNGSIVRVPANSESTTHPEISRRLEVATEADLRMANQRAELVRAHLRGETLPQHSSVSDRTLRYWTAQYRVAAASCGAGYIGLLPQSASRGNRTNRLPEQAQALLKQFIEQEYETLKQQSRVAVYARLLKVGEEQGVQVPSYKTFCTEVKKRATAQQTLKRQGRRAAYQQETFYWELELTTPRHGDRPFEICHLDHTNM